MQSKQILKFLKEFNQEKKTTIILTSHYLEDIKALCKRTVVINHGVKLYDGATDELFEGENTDAVIERIYSEKGD